MRHFLPHARGKGLVNGIPAVLGVTSAFALWEIYVQLSGISTLILPAPSRVVDQIAQNRALLWGHTVPTMKATLAGFACPVFLSERDCPGEARRRRTASQKLQCAKPLQPGGSSPSQKSGLIRKRRRRMGRTDRFRQPGGRRRRGVFYARPDGG